MKKETLYLFVFTSSSCFHHQSLAATSMLCPRGFAHSRHCIAGNTQHLVFVPHLDSVHRHADGCCSLTQPALPTALAVTLTSGSRSLAGESPEFPYQGCFQPWVLCLLVGASAQSGSLSSCWWMLKPSPAVSDSHSAWLLCMPVGVAAWLHLALLQPWSPCQVSSCLVSSMV